MHSVTVDRSARRPTARALLASFVVFGLVAVAAAGEASGSGPGAAVIDPGDGGRYAPAVDPTNFAATIDNPYLPMTPGSRWVYEGRSGGEIERTVVTVTQDRRTVMGIPAVVVRDTVSVDGDVVEDTFDWFAQDKQGNVWYLGEDSKEYDRGEVVSTAGSWEAGIDGALPGVVMRAAPAVGDAYRQEYLRGEAEDMAQVVRLGGRARVPFGRYDDLLVTKEWTPLEPKTVEKKYYAAGIGLVRERTVRGGAGRIELVDFTRSS
jgi:hypothetical protein